MKHTELTKVTQKDLAAFYNITTQSLRNYRFSEDTRMQSRYLALKEYYIRQTENKS